MLGKQANDEDDAINALDVYVLRLKVTSYRNYVSEDLCFENGLVVLTGSNGAGKTNLLEAISFLSPGKGLRAVSRLELVDSVKADQMVPSWGVRANIIRGSDEVVIGTGRDVLKQSKRTVKIEGHKQSSQAVLPNYVTVMWLTPQMDGLFIGSSSDRRKFLDRLVYNFNPEHASSVYGYEHTMRQRAKLLQTGGDSYWLDSLELKMAEKSIAIAHARLDALHVIQEVIDQTSSPFPKARIGVEGEVETLCTNLSALEAEEQLVIKLKANRVVDAQSKRTNLGVHRSDMAVIHTEKNMPAASCSTGEQKAMLLSIILAEAKAKMHWKRQRPILLLDEVVAHLDEQRREYLFQELLNMKCQTFMTGTDSLLFEGLADQSQYFTVDNGSINAS